jgi:putative CocE/NonD family hydrolase
MALTPEEYRKIDIPILTITGHYDGDQPGAMHYYRSHMQTDSTRGCAKHFLVIGPWDHAGTRTPSREFAGLKLGEACMLDMNELHKNWFDWTLKGGAKPEFLKNQVAYYVMGSDEWKYAESLGAISNVTRRMYLNSFKGKANDVFHSGNMIGNPPGESQPDSYIYDPLDVRPAELEREEIKNYLTDQRYDLNLFGNGLIYHSDPFKEPVEITGYVKLSAWISLDVPDTDFAVTLSEILLDGSRIQLTQDFKRARYRRSLVQEELVKPGEIEYYEFNTFTFFSRRIAKGSRLRLLICSPNSIHIQKNYNSGGVIAEETGAEAYIAHVTLFHDEEHPSFLELPIVQDC